MATFVPILGTLNGSISGTTFKRSRYGYAASRKRAKANRVSMASQSASINLSLAASLWQTIDSTRKSNWSSFATEYFKPLRTEATGLTTGFNAFVALRSVLNYTTKNAVCTVNPAANISSIVQTAMYMDTEAPVSQVQPSANDGVADTPFSLYAPDCWFNSSGGWQMSLEFLPSPILSSLRDSAGNALGFVVYASAPLRNANSYSADKYRFIVGYAKPFTTFDTSATDTNTRFELQGIPAVDFERVKMYYRQSLYVDLSVCTLSIYGNLNYISTIRVQIS